MKPQTREHICKLCGWDSRKHPEISRLLHLKREHGPRRNVKKFFVTPDIYHRLKREAKKRAPKQTTPEIRKKIKTAKKVKTKVKRMREEKSKEDNLKAQRPICKICGWDARHHPETRLFHLIEKHDHPGFGTKFLKIISDEQESQIVDSIFVSQKKYLDLKQKRAQRRQMVRAGKKFQI